MSQVSPEPSALAAAWYADPTGRYAHRYWDGQAWTSHVSTDGAQALDEPVVAPTSPAGHEGGPQEQESTPQLIDELALPRFGVRSRAKELASQLRETSAERDRLLAERDRLAAFGALEAAELDARRENLTAEVAGLEKELATQRASANAAIDTERARARWSLDQELGTGAAERDALVARVAELRGDVVQTEELSILQEVGVYEYRHPLSDAIAYQAELKRLQDRVKTMAKKDGGAVLANNQWTVNDSAAKGRAMIRDYSKLILRAYNAEADNLVRGLKPYKLESSVDRLMKVATTIERLGKTMDIRIAADYQHLRITELELTADYLEKKAEEKEREREEKARLREERKVQQEMDRERERLDKERAHHESALTALIGRGDEAGAARVRAQLADVDRKIEDVDYRAANIRAGFVYVISNLGSFGGDVIKVGLTRRLEPMDRVRELGDASVPFRFDVHALLFSQDAVGLEAALHQRLASKRMNLVNRRREFFRATPREVKDLLVELEAEILEYDEQAAAVEYRQSVGGDKSQTSDDSSVTTQVP